MTRPGGGTNDQRYYTATEGRFYTPDLGGIFTADPKDPTSWNRYTYANDDPINFFDPAGRYAEWAGGWDGSGLGDWDYCDISCEQNTYWTNVGTNTGVATQNLICQALAAAFNYDGGAWNANCGSPPSGSPTLSFGGGPADCAAALEELTSATATVLGRVGDIIRYGGKPDPGYIKALRQAVNRLKNAVAKVVKSCASVAGAAAAIAAAESALEAAAPYLLVAVL